MGKTDLIDAEIVGHEGAHGVYALDNPAEAVELQTGINNEKAAIARHDGSFPLPPDVMNKINTSLNKTETFAQQTEQGINAELQANSKKKGGS